ncbi:MAG: DUF3822 family protein [Prolixibacteraceae bacterium]|nr:DUF3822 family protein [Prolixibacteraceae bacterium]
MQPSLQFIDETFDINSCKNYVLSIQCSLDGFSFSVYDPHIEKFTVLIDYYLICATPYQLKNEIADIYNDEKILTQNFRKVTICYITQKTLISPKAISLKNEDEILKLCFTKERDDVIVRKDYLNNKTQLSLIPGIVHQFFTEKINNASFVPPSTVMLLRGEANMPTAPQVSVYKHNHILHIAFFENQKLLVFNSFYAKNENDELFYLLNMAKEQSSANNTSIYLYGDFYENGSFHKLLKSYFNKISFAHYNHQYTVSYTFYKKPAHIYLPLLELALCE